MAHDSKHKTSAKPDREHVKGMYACMGNMAASGNGPQVRQLKSFLD